MRGWTDCKHFWELIGPKNARRFDGHAMARCRYCRTWTVTDLDNIGPCYHSMGQRAADYVSEVNIPLVPEPAPAVSNEWVTHEEGHDCPDCNAARLLCPEGCQCFLHVIDSTEEVL